MDDQKLREELDRAIEVLGGVRRASRIADVGRSTLAYWLHVHAPHWATPYIERVIAAAADPANHKPTRQTPEWALRRRGRNDSTTRRLERA